MKRILTILTILAFAATAQANSYGRKDHNADRDQSPSFHVERLIQQVADDCIQSHRYGNRDEAFNRIDWEHVFKGSGHKFDRKEAKRIWENHCTEIKTPPSTNVADGGASILMLGFGLLALAGAKQVLRR